MRNTITKGEAARLLGITKTQIRFYEKKGLIEPIVADNGYYMYSFNVVKEMEVILFLREMDTPISEIKKMIASSDDYNYIEILENSYDKINLELKSLAKKRKDIQRKISLYKRSHMDDITIEFLDERVVHVADVDFDQLSIKDVYDLTEKYDVEFRDFKNELCRSYHGNEIIAGLINSSKATIKGSVAKHVLPAGEYISYTFFLDSYSEFNKKKQEFDAACNQLEYELSEDLLHIEHFAKTYYGKGKAIITFQKLIVKEI